MLMPFVLRVDIQQFMPGCQNWRVRLRFVYRMLLRESQRLDVVFIFTITQLIVRISVSVHTYCSSLNAMPDVWLFHRTFHNLSGLKTSIMTPEEIL